MRGLYGFLVGAAVLTALLVGWSTLRTDAADCLEDVASFSGHVQDTDTYEFDYCDDASFNLTASLLWSNANKDLALRLTSPTGDIYFEDSHGGFFPHRLQIVEQMRRSTNRAALPFDASVRMHQR